jgi:formylglycine-generating enzyme
MNRLRLVLIIIVSAALSLLYFESESIESKKAKKSDDTAKNPKTNQGDKFKNSIGMEFVYIEPGKFKMGSGESAEELAKIYGGNADIYETERQHDVTITKGYWIQITEVTVAQFRKFVEDTNYKTTAEEYQKSFDTIFKNDWDNPFFNQTDMHPVVVISWNDTIAFCEWLSKNDEEGNKYRLPTEAEWEYACRAGSTTAYYWGEKMNKDYCWYDRNSRYGTQSVKTRKPNQWGLYDMSGNVYEWCSDLFDKNSVPQSDKSDDAYKDEKRVLRGGSWTDYQNPCRSAFRLGWPKDDGQNFTGFRVVRDCKENRSFTSATQSKKDDDRSFSLYFEYKFDDRIFMPQPPVASGKIVCFLSDNFLHAVDIENRAVLWTLPVEYAGEKSLFIEEDTLYYGDDENGSEMRAVDLKSGKVNWIWSLREPLDYKPVSAYMCKFRDLFFCATLKPSFACLNLKTQTVELQIDLSNEVHASAGALVNEGTVYFGDDGGIMHAIDIKTHKESWSYNTNGQIQIKPIIDNGNLYFSNTDGNLYALDCKNGNKRWIFQTGLPTNMEACIDKGLIYVCTPYGIRVLDEKDGKIRRKFYGNGGAKAPIINRGNIFFADGSSIIAFELNTGRRKCEIRKDNSVSGPILIGKDLLCFSATNGALYVYKLHY